MHVSQTKRKNRWQASVGLLFYAFFLVASSFTVALSSSVEVRAQSTTCTPVSAMNLAGHWKLNENTGISTADSSGNGHTGTLQNGPTWTSGTPAISPNASALSFDGTDDMVTVAGSNAFNFGTGSFTVTAFARTGSGSGNRSVLGNYSASNRGWGLYFYANNSVNFFGYGDAGTNDMAKPATILDNQWHHVAGVYKRTGNSLTIETYVDGAFIGSQTATVGDITSNSDLLFGRYLGQPNYQGSLDDIRVYARALTASEVDSLSEGCGDAASSSSSSVAPCTNVSTMDLAAYWKLNEQSGSVAMDSTSHNNQGSLNGGAGWTAMSAPLLSANPSALDLNGTSAYVSASDTTGLPAASDDRTIALWMNADSIAHQGTLVALGNGASSAQKFIVMMGNEPASGPTYLFTDGVNGANNITVSGTEVPSMGAWHHVAFTFDGVSAWSYYLDGVLKKSGTFAVPINTVTNAVEIGARHDAVNGFYDGKLDDVRVYGRVLTASEISSLAEGCGNAENGSSSSQSSTPPPNGDAPTCDGMTATIYVKKGKVVGGPMNGQPYNGILRGTDGNDVMVGTNRADIIGGKQGDDLICSGKGNDVVYGDGGNDTVHAGNGRNTVIGGSGNDTVKAGNGRNVVLGNTGDDMITVGNGANFIDGGQGTDTCIVGRGRHNIVLRCEEPSDDEDQDEDEDEDDE